MASVECVGEELSDNSSLSINWAQPNDPGPTERHVSLCGRSPHEGIRTHMSKFSMSGKSHGPR